jgi:VCBS repeat-containing protein
MIGRLGSAIRVRQVLRAPLTGLITATCVLLSGATGSAQSQASCDASGTNCIAISPNVNVLRTAGNQYRGDIFLQRQNEPGIAVSTRNPNHIMIAANDYRTVDFANDTAPGDTLTRVARAFTSGVSELFAKLTGREPFFENKRDEAVERLDASAPAEAWIGLYLSNDGGKSYASYLMPGYPEDTTTVGKSTPAFGKAAGSDPVLASGPAGRMYLGAMVYDRDPVTKEPVASKIVVSRFTDLNNAENGQNFHFDGMTLVDDGGKTKGRKFLDKPAIAVDYNRKSSDPNACGNVYIAYTVFDTQEKDSMQRSKILISRSRDCGVHFEPPQQLSHRSLLNQGVSLAIRPSDGGVFAAYRSFSENKIYIAFKDHDDEDEDDDCDFNPSLPISGRNPILPFDQPTLPAPDYTFRTNGFPTVAIDGQDRMYVAWQERIAGDPTGKPAIMITSSTTGGWFWTPKSPVEPTRSVLDASGNPTAKSAAYVGPQIMPSLSSSRGKLMLVFFEARTTDFHAVPSQSNAYYIAGKDAELNVRVAQLDVTGHVMGSSVFVNHYDTDKDGNVIPVVSKESDGRTYRGTNRPNLPMYASGTSPFMGDYIALVPTAPFVPVTQPVAAAGTGNKKPSTGPAWRFATDPSDAPAAAFITAWDDHRDVLFPMASRPDGSLYGTPTINGDWTKYAPPNTGAASCINPGSRNSNVYASILSPRLFAGSPSSFKQLGIQRAFVIYVQNQTMLQKYYRLTIVDAPPTVTGSFNQFGLPQKVLDVTVYPNSMVTQNVFAIGQNQSVATQPFAVTVQEILPPLGAVPANTPPNPDAATVVFNTDPGNPPTADSSNELHSPAIVNPDPSHQNPSDPQVSNPQVSNPQVSNPQVSNPQVSNPQVSNPQVSNPQVSNPQVSNPQVSNPQVSNVPLSDGQDKNVYTNVTNYTWEVKNAGNTVSAFAPVINIARNAELANKKVTLTIYKTYKVPGLVMRNGQCVLVDVPKDIVLSRVENPQVSNPQVSNPQVSNPQVSNPQVSNPQVSNPQVSNPQVSNPQVSNATFFVAPSDLAIDPATLSVDDAKTYLTLTVQDANPDGTPAAFIAAPPPAGSDPNTGAPLPPPNPPLPPQSFSTGDSAVAVTATSTNVVNGAVQSIPEAATTGSDLVISTPPTIGGAATSIGDGATITFSSTSVQNTGSTATPATGFKYGFFLSPTPQIDLTTAIPLTPVTPATLTYTGSIPTCASSPSSCTVTLAGGSFVVPATTPAGSYYVGIRINSGDVSLNQVHVFEPEDNDSYTAAVIIVADLAIAQASVTPTTAYAGQAVTASIAVANLSPTTPTPASVTSVTLTNAANTVIAGPILVPTPAIAAGGSTPVTASLTVPSGSAPGTYTVTARVDAGGSIVESNESNNVATRTFSVINSTNTLTFQQQPPATIREAKVFPSTVAVRVLNRSNAPIVGASVQLALAEVSGTGVLTGATTATTNASGVATFPGLMVSRNATTPAVSAAGNYLLSATVANVGAVTSAQFTVTANGIPTATNDPTGANAAAYTVSHVSSLNVPVSVGLLANDSDPDADPLTAVLLAQPPQGTVALNANGSFTYTPNGSFTGSDSFTYRAFDGLDYSLPATVFIAVTDRAPTATADSFSVSHTGTLNGNVLANDSDPDSGDDLTALIASYPTHGGVTLNADGTFQYVPMPTYVGSDSFTYFASDGFTTSAQPATVTIAVTNGAPVASLDSYNAPANVPLNIAAPGVLANDTDPDHDTLTAALASGGPSHGTVTLNADGSFTYQPTQQFTGTDSFNYTVSDGFGGTATATVQLTVTNGAPTATDDSFQANDGASTSMAVLANDTDPNNDTLTIQSVSSAQHGTVQNNSTSVTYTSTIPYAGSDSFTYTISDGHGHTATATVNVTVNHVNHSPVANPDTAFATAGTPTTINVLANDSDPDAPFGSVIASISFLPTGAPANLGFLVSAAFNPTTNTVQVANGRRFGSFAPATSAISAGPLATFGANGARSVVNPSTGYAYFRSGTSIIAVDPASNSTIATLSVGGTLGNFDVDAAHNRLYATYVLPAPGANTSTQSGVDIFDISAGGATSHQIVGSVPISGIGGMMGLAIDSAHQIVYISSNSQSGGVGKIDLSGATPVTSFVTGSVPAGEIAFNAAANVIVESHLQGANSASIAIIDLNPATPVVTLVPLPGFVTQNSTAPGYNAHLAINPVTGRAYVRSLDTHLDHTGNLYVVDALPGSQTFGHVTTIPMGIDALIDDVVIGPAKVVATAASSNQLGIVDATTNAMTSLTLSQAPVDVTIDAANNRAFVAGAYSVFTVSLNGTPVVSSVDVGAEAEGPAVDTIRHRAYAGRVNGPASQVILNKDGLVGTVPGLASTGRWAWNAVNPSTGQLFVLNTDSNATGSTAGIPSYVDVFNEDTNAIAGPFTVGDNAFGAGLNPATNVFYVGGGGSAFARGTITAIDGNALSASAIDVSAFENSVAFAREFVVNTATNAVYFRVNNSQQGITGGVINGSVATPLPASLGTIQIFKVNPTLNHVYVGNSAGQVIVLNGANNQSIATLNAGATSTAVGTQNYIAADAATGRLFVADFNKNIITVFDGNNNYAVVATLPTGKGPTPVAINTANHRVYVGNALDNTLTVIDGASAPPVVLGMLTLPRPANFLAVDPAENRIYATNGAGTDAPGALVISDAGTAPALTVSAASGAQQGGVVTDGQSVTYTPLATASGVDTFQYTASDGQASSSATVTVNVTPALTITTTTLADGGLNQPYDHAISATGGVGPYFWTLQSGALPGGLALAASGHVQGVPDTTGTFTFTVQATDSASPQPHVAVKAITVSTGSLTILTTSLPSAVPPVGTQSALQYSFALTAGGSSLPLTWNWAAAQNSTVPPGLSLNPQTGVISGLPTQNSCTSSTFIVTVSDTANHTAQQQFTLFYTGPLTITSTTLPTAITLEGYGFTPGTTCGTGGTRTWSITGLPTGLTFSTSNGQINATVNGSGPRQTGDFPLQVHVTDGTTNAAQSVTLSVMGVDQQPSFGSASGNPPNLAAPFTVPPNARIAQTFTSGVNGSLTGVRFLTFNGPTAALSCGTGTNNATLTIEGVLPTSGLPDDSRIFAGPTTFTLSATSNTIVAVPAIALPADASFSVVVTSPNQCTITGGQTSDQYLGGAAYQYSSGAWSPMGSTFDLPMHTLIEDANLSYFTLTHGQTRAVTLANGNILLVGSQLTTTGQSPNQVNATTAEIINPNNNGAVTIATTAVQPRVRQDATVTLLTCPASNPGCAWGGRVLIAGGSLAVINASQTATATADIYDPVANTFTPVGPMNQVRVEHSATLLQDGRVLFVGGCTQVNCSGNSVTNTAEIFDPATNTFTSVQSMIANRNWQTATLLNDGRVMVAGGFGQGSGGAQSVEIYTPGTNTWTFAAPLQTSRGRHTATLLADGTVLIAGGQSTTGNNSMAATAELYDPIHNTFTAAGTMIEPRGHATATLLPSGCVVFTGGVRNPQFAGSPWASTESWSAGTFTQSPDLNVTRYDHAAVLLSSGPFAGRIAVLGGFSGNGGSRQAGQTFEFLDATPGQTGTPYITNPNLPDGARNTAYAPVTLTVAGGQPPYTLSVLAPSALPAGLTLGPNASNPTCPAQAICGTPTAAGTFEVAIQIQDSNAPSHVGTSAVRIRINPLDITTAALANAYVSKPYSVQLAATGVPPLTWSLLSGVLPNAPANNPTPGYTLTLNANGTITGTPTRIVGQFNDFFTFTVKVVDSLGQSATRQLSINVNNPFTILTSSIPDGLVTTGYTNCVIATANGVSPFSFAVTGGTPPAGLAFQSSGTCFNGAQPLKDTGTYTFTVTGTDSSNPAQTDTKTYTIQVHGQDQQPFSNTVANVSLPPSWQVAQVFTSATPYNLSGVMLSNFSCPANTTVTADVFRVIGSPAQPDTSSGPLATASMTTNTNGFFPSNILGFTPGVSVPQHGQFAVRLTVSGGTCTGQNWPAADQYLNGNGWVSINGGAWQLLSDATAGLGGPAVYDAQFSTLVNPTHGLTFTSTYINGAASVTLADGRILVFGNSGGWTKAEIFDPSTNTSTPTSGAISSARSYPTLTRLSNGKVLIVGGVTYAPSCCTSIANTSIDLFDPAAGGTFSHLGDLPLGLYFHTATRLTVTTPGGDDLVLVAGGQTTNNGNNTDQRTAYVIDGFTGQIVSTLNMTGARTNHTATLLADGTVLIAGGWQGNPAPPASSELFVPAVTAPYGAFTAGPHPMQVWRSEHTATLMSDGRVFLIGGGDGHYPNLEATTEFYDPASQTFTAGPSLTTARHYHAATLLSGSRVLVTGGNADWTNGSSATSSTEIYDPTFNANSGGFQPLGDLLVDRNEHTAALIASGVNAGNVLVAGSVGDSALSGHTFEIFAPVAGSGLTVTTTTVPDASSNTSYSAPLSAIGGSGGNTWSIVWGQTPPGISLTSGGVLTGNLGANNAGVYSFVVQVTDSAAHTARRQLTITVDRLTITTTSLPNGMVSHSYTASVAVTGGSGTRTWTLDTNSTLPNGISLDAATGALGGSPTAAGSTFVNIRVTDTTGHSVARGFTLTIVSVPPPSANGESYSVMENLVLSSTGNPISWWRADGTAGDRVGVNNGILHGNAGFAAGRVGQAFSTDHDPSTYIDMGTDQSLNPGGAFSLGGWFYIDPNAPGIAGRSVALTAKGNGGSAQGGWYLGFDNSTSNFALGWTVFGNPITIPYPMFDTISVSNTITTAGWYHVLGTFDPSAAQHVKLYLNGTLVGSGTARIPSMWQNNAYHMRIGASNAFEDVAYNDHFPGRADDVQFFGRALTDREVANLASGSLSVLDNDSAPSGLPLSAVLVTPPAHGNVSLASDGTFTYTPGLGYIGGDTFTYKATDGVQESTPATVSITVIRPNTPPVATDDAFSTPMNTTLVAGPLPSNPVSWWRADGNGADAQAHNPAQLTAMSFEAARSSLDGQAFAFDGSASYVKVPASASTNVGASGSFSIEGWINPADLNNPHPIFEWNNQQDYGVHVWHSFPDAGNLFVNIVDTTGAAHETDALGVIQAGVWQHIALTYDAPNGMARLYVNGVEATSAQVGTFTPQTSYDLYLGYRASAGGYAPFGGGMDDVAVVNRALTAAEVWADANCACVSVLANDTDADHDPLTAQLVTAPQHGALALNANGTFTYTPTAGYQGSDAFTYVANDGAANSNVATVNITVTGASLDAPPVAFANTAFVPANTATIIGVYPASPSSRWPADGNTNDVVGGHNGVAPYTTYSAGRSGQAFTFDGGDNPIDVGTGIYSTTAVTFGAWVFPENVADPWGGAGFILGDGRDCCGSPNGGVGLHLTDGGGSAPQSPRAFFYRGVDDQVEVIGQPMTANAWHHVVFTFDGVSLTLYQDGLATATTTFAPTTIQPPVCSLKIGVDNFCGFGDVYPFHGKIDDVSIFNRALTPGEVLQWSQQITGGDVDTNAANLQYIVTAEPQHGTLSAAMPTPTYTPFTGYVGLDSFTYYVSDGVRQSTPVTITIQVGPLRVPDDYPTIQSAIDAAPGDSNIEVASGTYYENLDWENKALTISGANATTTIIDGGSNDTVLHVKNVPATSSISGFTFTDGWSGNYKDWTTWGGGIYLENAPITVYDSVVVNNRAGGGGGIAVRSSNATIRNVVISNNIADDEGGGVDAQSSSPLLLDDTITSNQMDGIFSWAGDANIGPIVVNSLIASNGNAQPAGSGIGVWNSALTLINSTVVNNTPGGVLDIDTATDHVVITNSILWHNGTGPDLEGFNNSTVVTSGAVVSYSIVGSGYFTPGAGVSAQNPLFVDSEHGNYRLQWSSPAIDMGNNAALPPTITTDLAGDTRIINGTIDLGPYEFGTTFVTATVGGNGGSPFPNIVCPAGRFGTALAGQAGDDIDRLDLYCGTPPTYAGSTSGQTGGNPFTLACPAGYTLTGLYGTAGVVNWGGTVVDTIGGTCTNNVNGSTYQTGTVGNLAYVYGNPPPFSINCPAGAAVSGLYGHAGALLDQVGLICKQP